MVQFSIMFYSFDLQDAVEYAECEAAVKDFPPFREAMKRRGIEDMDLVMVGCPPTEPSEGTKAVSLE